MSAVGVLRTPEERFAQLPGHPFAAHYVDVPGPAGEAVRMHYVDEGPREAPVVLLVHGEPTWSYLWRKLVPVLADAGLRAVAPDLVGFGRSDKPVDKTTHSFERHVGWLHALVRALDLRRITLVGQDWGGPLGMAVLARDEDRFARVVAANTMLHTLEPELAGRLRWAAHGAGEGEVCLAEGLLAWIAFSQRAERMQARVAVQGSTLSEVPEPVLAAYDAPFPDERYQAGMRQLPILIPLTRGDAGARLNRATWEVLRRFERPFLTAFSDGDPGTAGWDAVFRERVPGAGGQLHVTIRGAGHFLQEDRGEELAAVVRDFARGR